MSLRDVVRGLNAAVGHVVTAASAEDMAASIEFYIPTGSWMLDQALGGHGLAGGRIVEYWGDSQTGKTTMAAAAMKSAQDMGGVAAFIDVESSLDAKRLRQLSVSTDMDKDFVYVHDPGIDIPMVFKVCISLATELPPYSLMVMDTLAACQAGSDGSGGMGKRPIQLRNGFRELTPLLAANSVTLLILNHSSVSFGGFGASQCSGGGAALAFWASQSIKLAYGGKFQIGEHQLGLISRAYILKNKDHSPPAQPKLIKYPLRYVSGVDRSYELWHFLADNGFKTLDEQFPVCKSGSWCKIRGFPDEDDISLRYAGLEEKLEEYSESGLLEYLEMMAEHHIESVV